MSATLVAPDALTVSPAFDDSATRLSFTKVLRSEWIKQRSLRSTWITLGLTFMVLVGFGLIAALTASGQISTQGKGGGPFSSGTDAVSTVMTGANLAVLIVCVLGVLTGAREFTSGMIRTTVAAVPGRLSIVSAKILTFVALLTPVVVIGVLVAFLGGTQILTSAGATSASWGDAGVARAVLGTAIYLIGLGVIGVAFGMLLRSVAGGIALLIGGLLFLPTLAQALLPSSWDHVLKYLPSEAATSFTSQSVSSSYLSPTWGAVVFACWVVAAVIGALYVFRRRDV
jgi:ABC-type transport system involved in multi-copper enzyme maturation permease subunit